MSAQKNKFIVRYFLASPYIASNLLKSDIMDIGRIWEQVGNKWERKAGSRF